MKFKELKLMSEQDLDSKETELRKEIMKINSQIAIGTIPKNPGKLKSIKKAIAKIITIRASKKSGGTKKE